MDAFAWSDNRSNHVRDLQRTFFAHCHGETEVVSIPMVVLKQMRGFAIETAFAPKTLQEPETAALPPIQPLLLTD